MPDSAINPSGTALKPDLAVGFCGKIPARGDFVELGLPRGFTEPWNGWMERMLLASRDELRAEWLPAWLEAPVWRFALSPEVCGPHAAIGLWLPSVDHIGRHFSLTFALVGADTDPLTLLRRHTGFFTAAEAAGREALEFDLEPDELAGMAQKAAEAPASDPGIAGLSDALPGSLWWTLGAPRVPPTALIARELPGSATFTAMLDASASMGSASL